MPLKTLPHCGHDCASGETRLLQLLHQYLYFFGRESSHLPMSRMAARIATPMIKMYTRQSMFLSFSCQHSTLEHHGYWAIMGHAKPPNVGHTWSPGVGHVESPGVYYPSSPGKACRSRYNVTYRLTLERSPVCCMWG